MITVTVQLTSLRLVVRKSVDNTHGFAKVKASAKNVYLRYKHKFVDIYAIYWCELHQWLSAAAHVTR